MNIFVKHFEFLGQKIHNVIHLYCLVTKQEFQKLAWDSGNFPGDEQLKSWEQLTEKE